jgi:hypothetical protein
VVVGTRDARDKRDEKRGGKLVVVGTRGKGKREKGRYIRKRESLAWY